MATTKKARHPAPKRATLRDVALRAGVDPSLVSRVVNNDPKASLTEATRERILRAVDDLGYRANAAGRSLRLARTGTMGLLVPDFFNPMYGRLARAIELRAQEIGYGVVIGTHPSGEEAGTFTELLRQGRVDGLIVASGGLKDKFLRDVIQTNPRSVVLLNRHVPGLDVSVTMDDELGAMMATEHLLQLGHRNIAGVFGPAAIDTTKRRRRGFEKALHAAGVTPISVQMTGNSAEQGLLGALTILEQNPEVTAILASVFVMAPGVLRAAREFGRRVPDSLSVVALHDFEIAEYLTPPLSCIEMPIEEMSNAAVDMLASMLAGSRGSPVQIGSRPRLIDRGSLAPPKTLPVRTRTKTTSRS
jgi:LacI family transcriptional regulator